MRKLFTYCSLFILTACITDDNTSIRTPITNHSNSSSESNTNPRKETNATSTSSLAKLSSISDISNTILNQNVARITTAFLEYNKNNADTPIKMTKNGNNDSFVKALEYLAATKDTVNPMDIDDVIAKISQLSGDYTAYKNLKDQYDSFNYVLKTSADFTSENDYADYLQKNVSTDITKARRGVSTVDYIVNIEKAYFEKMQIALKNAGIDDFDAISYTSYNSTDGSAGSYKSLMAKLTTKLSELEADITAKTAPLLADLQALDSSITQMPLTIDTLVSDWLYQQRILTAVKDVEYISDTTTNPNDMNSSSLKENSVIADSLLANGITASSENVKNALSYIVASKRTTNPVSMDSVIDTIDLLNTNYTTLTATTTTKENLSNLPRLPVKNDSDSYEYYAASIGPQITRDEIATKDRNSDEFKTAGNLDYEKYIKYVYEAYYDYIREDETYKTNVSDALSGSEDEKKYTAENYTSLFDELDNKISDLDNDINAQKSDICNNLETLTGTTVSEVPANMNDVLSYWNLQKQILTTIKNLNYTPNTVVYNYNNALEDYTLDLSSNNKTVTFKANEFKLDTANRSYTATKDRDAVVTEEAIVTFPNLWIYLNAGGSSTTEFTARKNNVLAVFNAVKNNSATTAQIQDFKTWVTDPSTGTIMIDKDKLSNSSTEDSKLFDAVYKTLNSSKDVSLALSSTVKTTDTVHLGGNYSKLSFADYGVWKISKVTEYSGNDNLLTYYGKKNPEVSQSYIYPFFSGLDSLKQAYVADAASQNKTFTGNTIAYATLVGLNSSNTIEKALTGSAKLNINMADVTGTLSLVFEDWYQFNISGLDLSNKDGFYKENATTSLTTPSTMTSNNWLKSPDFTTTVSGVQYGLKENTPVEAVGAYSIETTGVAAPEKYSKLVIEGAFGVKE